MPPELTLPMAAEDLIPHRGPMLLVDRLVFHREPEARVEAVVRDDTPLVDEKGTLDGTALLEFMAQGCAAARGYQDLSADAPVKKGFLVGVRRFQVKGSTRAGDRLQIDLATVGTLEGFSIVDALVTRDGEVIATGTLKLWIMDKGSLPGEQP